MDLIVSHSHLDFDGLASMVAAQKIYPQGLMVNPGKLSPAVQEFMSLYKDSVPLENVKRLDLQQVKRLIVVDTNGFQRLGELRGHFPRSGVQVEVYDHHPAGGELPADARQTLAQVGAATTMMVELIREKGISLNPFEATILALGIYEDTGSLTFTSTTARDAAAVAYLLSLGANLQVVANFIDRPLGERQQMLLNALLSSAREYRVRGIDILVTATSQEEYVGGLGLLVEKLADVTNGDVVFAVVEMGGRVHLVGRSRVDSVSVNEVLAAFGGGGHPKAAAANIKGMPLAEVLSSLERELSRCVRPPVTARQIMSSPVKMVSPETSIDEAGRVMLRYGHSGLPVADNGKLVGIISRRDLEKAQHHGLGHAPVKGYMSRGIITISAGASVQEVQDLMILHDIGRLPVLEGERMVGIVSRSDVLRVLHGEHYPRRFHTMYQTQCPLACPMDTKKMVAERLPLDMLDLLRNAGEMGDRLGYGVYLVGGMVRDLLINVPNCDVDLAVEGDGVALAELLARELGGELVRHEQFHTATVNLASGQKVDVVTARREFYDYPASLPVVEVSTLREDLYRRDFTINAMAVQLNRERFGALVDFFCGYHDLERGIIRVLYNLSFVEDPTRILRAVRFEQRYGFAMDPQTLTLAKDPRALAVLSRLSGTRLWVELSCLLEEERPVQSVRRLVELGVWAQVLPGVATDSRWWEAMERVFWLTKRWEEVRGRARPLRRAILYLATILHRMEEEEVIAIGHRFNLHRQDLEVLSRVIAGEELLAGLEEDDLSPGHLHRLFREEQLETVLACLALTGREEVESRVLAYLEARESLHPLVSGDDLKDIGLKPGPIFADVLLDLECAFLEGKVRNRDEALAWIRGLS